MFCRLKRGAATLAMIVAAYFVYALVVVPFIEPSIKLRPSKRTNSRPPARVRKLDHLFPPGSWELGRSKVVETNQGTLLFDEYEPQPDGQLKLTRCTVICYVEHAGRQASSGAGNEHKRPIVLRAPRGATLTFDQNFDVLRGLYGHLVGGRLEGEITITSPASEPEKDDALEIVTRNVQLDSKRIWTPHDVRFRYGPNVGQGSDLTIYLAGVSKSTSGDRSLGVGRVKLLELVHLERLQLQLNDSGLFGTRSGEPSGVRTTPAKAPGDATQKSSVEVTCRGPLRFDFDHQIISLEDQVDLMRHNANGPSDQLLCQLMEIHFASGEGSPSNAQKMDSRPAGKKPFGKFMPTKVIASGYPVIIRAESVGIGTRAERIEYDCIERRVWLKDRNKVMFQDRQRRFEARELGYTLAENGRIGDLAATGPGNVHARLGTPPRDLEITWQDKVAVRRIDGRPVLSFTSRARATLVDTGSFAADTLHLYLNETPKPDDADKVLIEADRLHAIGQVIVESADLNAHVQEAKLWFRSPPRTPDSSPVTLGSINRGTFPDALNPANLFGNLSADVPKAARHKFQLQAQVVEALVILGDQPVADRLAVRGGVELREITDGEQRPLIVRGELFELQEGASEHPRGALLGKPAEVIARDMSIQGETFYLYPADNLLDMSGPGEMTFPPKLAADPTKRVTQPARVTWKDQLHFDGETARFEGGVSVHVTQQNQDGETRGVALGDVLRVQLTQQIDFQNPQVGESVDLAEFGFDGWGFFEIETLDQAGQCKLTQQMQVRQLTVNQVTGEIHGLGPGWMRGIHRGRDVTSQKTARPFLPSSTAELNFLRVDFAQQLTGNLHHRQLEFHNGARTLYGPVGGWDEALDQLAESDLPPSAVILTCERLGVTQMAEENNADHIELEATGNAYVEGHSFSASGGRISYSRAKDQLILEGDGHNNATLAFQKQPGERPSYIAADELVFWPSTGQFKGVRVKPSQFFNVGPLRSERTANVLPR